ncbi:SPW repeat domain-containing protein [Tellurirhabdus rosea]|uniref:SPW repeat domain-containing protein n=1 Tax=Tellurirhabdus rosea TaxID=2674997 RepID=UPI002256AC4B|nr:SPW repeat protein [Tellurirhabdus rosea]
MIRFIPTKVHGVIDYAAGATFMASPWLFGFADDTAATYVPVGIGVAALGTSLFTDYELGAVRKIPMEGHLAGDIAQGVAFLAAPYVFGFARRVKWPHLLFGAFAIGAGLLTKTQVGR